MVKEKFYVRISEFDEMTDWIMTNLPSAKLLIEDSSRSSKEYFFTMDCSIEDSNKFSLYQYEQSVKNAQKKKPTFLENVRDFFGL